MGNILSSVGSYFLCRNKTHIFNIIITINLGRSAFKILQVNLKERDLWGGLGVDGRTILEWTL